MTTVTNNFVQSYIIYGTPIYFEKIYSSLTLVVYGVPFSKFSEIFLQIHVGMYYVCKDFILFYLRTKILSDINVRRGYGSCS